MQGRERLVNPFKPTAGMTPPLLVGRESVLDDFRDGLDEGPGAPSRLMRITGPRGSGKTVLLTRLGQIASKRGWTVINVSGQEALCASIQEQLAWGRAGAFPRHHHLAAARVGNGSDGDD